MVAQIESQQPSGNVLDTLADFLSSVIDRTDEEAAVVRVRALKEKYPNASTELLVSKLTQQKCLMAAGLGALTPGLRLIGLPVNLGLIFKWQAELVLEVAVVHNLQLDDLDKRRIVLVVTGVSLGASQISRMINRRVERFASRILAQPQTSKVATTLIGSGMSAATNALFTYLIARRAHAYFQEKRQRSQAGHIT